ncbi:MAG: hypothetical protein FJW36_16100 [Acidobacteria bacterium]|nr:hypothetical protein [Acidobacteriota bacterium]
MAEWNSLIEEAQRQAGEQFEAAWKLHVERVSETLESGWRENIARVVEHRFSTLKNDLTAANEQYLAEKVEQEVAARLDGEWQARLDEHKQKSLDEEFERRVNEAIESRVTERLEAELPGRIEAELQQRLDVQVAARLEDEVALRMAQVLPEKIELGVQEQLNVLLPERVQEALATRLAEEIPAQVGKERAAWEEEFLPLVEQAREDVRVETAEKTRDSARRELGLQLSQALRVFRRAADGPEWKNAFLDAVQPYCALAALFLVTQDRFSLEGVRGMAGELETGFDLEFEEAAAFYNSLESKDIVVAVRSDSEVSPYVMSLRPDADSGKCFLFPVMVHDTVAALLYIEPNEQPLEVGAVEALVTAAGLTLLGIRASRQVQVSSLVNIATAMNPEDGDGANIDRFVPVPVGALSANGEGAPGAAVLPERTFNWDDLTQEQRELHMRAQRFARVQVAEMRLYKDDAVKAGRRDSNIYLRLKSEIDEARERYLAQFLDGQTHMRDYLHGELVETLAIDNPQLMGPDYPGSLVA